MKNYPIALYTAKQTREIDRIAIEQFNIPGSTLMARAADSVLKHILKHHPDIKRVAILCGGGNNGGDGLVLARLFKSLRVTADVFLLTDPEKFKDEALEAFESLRADQVTMARWDNQSLQSYQVVVDAIFGSGLDRDVEGPFAEAILAINNSCKPVFAMDIPSGLNADTGCVMGVSVKATHTVTFVGLKRGLLTADGPDHCGELLFDALQISDEIYNQVENQCVRIDLPILRAYFLPKRKHNVNKSDFGHVLVVGGNHGLHGAALLASTAALRTGAGLVSLSTRKEFADSAVLHRPEIMTLATEKPSELREQLSRASVVALGPGLAQDRWAEMAYKEATESSLPLVVDADALNLLAKNSLVRGDWILTPHPGEAARLLESSVNDVQQDRFAAATELAKKYAAIVVLKGCGTIVTDGETCHVCPYGNPGMASGGMGDALTGVIAALVAQGLGLLDAARLGVAIHARAGDLAAENGMVGLVASDLIEKIRGIL